MSGKALTPEFPPVIQFHEISGTGQVHRKTELSNPHLLQHWQRQNWSYNCSLIGTTWCEQHSIVEDYHASQDRIDEVLKLINAARTAVGGGAGGTGIVGSNEVIDINAPKEVMLGLLWWMEKKYGSISAYLASIGFTHAKQDLIKHFLLEKDFPN